MASDTHRNTDLSPEELRQRLRLAEERFEALSESISDLYWEVDADYNLTHASHRIQETLIDTGFLTLGENMFQALEASDNPPENLVALHDLFKRNKPFRNYLVSINHEAIGSLSWHTSADIIEDDEGNFAGYRGIAEDVSEKIAAEHSVKLQSLVMQGMTESVFILGEDNVIKAVNASVETLLGIPKKELVGRNVVEDLWPALGIDEDIVEEAIDAISAEGEWKHEVLVQLPTGIEMLVEVRLFTVNDEGEINSGRVLIARDITAERAAENSLKKVQEDLLEVQRIARIGSWEWTPEKDVTVCSDSMVQMYGLDETEGHYSPEQLLQMVHQQYRPAMEEALAAIFSGKLSSWETEFVITNGYGKDLWIHSQWFAIVSDDGQPLSVHGTVQDVTAQKEVELELRQSDDRLRDIVSATSDVIWSTNEHHQIVYRSQNFADVTGEHVDHNMASVPWETEEAKRNPESFVDYRKAFESQKPFRGIRTKVTFEDGSDIYWENSGNPVFRDDGSFDGFRGAATNITPQVQAEEELRQSEQRLRDILGATSDLVWETDANFQLSYISDQYSLHAGEQASTVIGEAPWDAPETKNYSEDWAVVRRAMESHSAYRDIRVRAEYTDGRIMHWSTSGQPIYDAEDNFIGYRGASSDVTAQIQAEEELQYRDAETRAIMSNAPIGLASADIDGRIKSFNQAASEIFGYSSQAVIDKSIFYLFPDEFLEEHNAEIGDFLKRGATLQPGAERRRVIGKRSNDREFPVDISIAIAKDDVREDLYVISFFDVTEQQETEEKLRQANRMEAVGQLTGGIAHDFNNLMMSMQLNLEFLMEKMIGDEEGEEFVTAALTAVTRGSALTSRLLSFSRQQKLSDKAIDISVVIDDLMGLLRRTMPDSMDIETTIDSDLWQTNVDPHQLENAILNLAINARDAISGSGMLTIASYNHVAGRFHPTLAQELLSQDHVCISVSDNGSGMPPEIVDHVFEPFFTTKDIGKGSGLGLSMVYGFVSQSGGQLAIDTQEGEGTTIEMFFPRSPQDEDPVEAEVSDPETVKASSGRVLIVEDNVDVLKALEKSVQGMGYDVYTASSGAHALEVISTDDLEPDILLTDVAMPDEMTGYELAKAVRDQCPDCHVLIMSGQSMAEASDDDRVPEGSVFIQKPFSMKQLDEKLREAKGR